MNIKPLFSFIWNRSKSLLTKAWSLLQERGLDDNVIQFALKWVKVAEVKYVDPKEKREWVVQLLMAQLKLPEGVVRAAVELAVVMMKQELAKLGA